MAAGQPVEVVVVDNASDDNTDAIARSAGARVVRASRRSAAAARNTGARAARGDILAFVDADHEIGPDWITGALDSFADPAVVAVGAQYHAPVDGTWVQRTYDRFRHRAGDRQVVQWLPSGNLAVRREAFERLHGFDETLEACEDVDFCQRLTAAGGVLLASPALRSVHLGDPLTLSALFRGELWRGRNNLRVSFRGPRSLPVIASALIPVANLCALAAIATGALLGGTTGRVAAVAGLATLALSAVARAVRLLRTKSGGDARTQHLALDAAQALAVAAVYDAARACALVLPASHGVRR